MANASPTYRGFRKQFIYILWRILCDNKNDNLAYQPEKIEDLAVYEYLENNKSTFLNRARKLKELIQVKDYTTPLTFSDFNPDKIDSFFHRVIPELTNVTPIIISYGSLGPELKGWSNREPEYIRSITDKLIINGLHEKDAYNIVSQTILQEINYDILEFQIIEKLIEGPTSPDPKSALDLLLKWIYDCCENSTLIAKQDVFLK